MTKLSRPLADLGYAMQNVYWPVVQMAEMKYFSPENFQWVMSGLNCVDFDTVARRHARAMERLRYQYVYTV